MELIFRKGSNATPLRLLSHGALSVGRSQSTDYQVDGLRVSAVHVKITEGPDPTTLTVTDVSHNGTGLVARGTTPAAATMLHRATTTVKVGTGILLPVEQPGGATQRTVGDVLWIETREQPDRERRESPPLAPLPLQAARPTPATWPSKWATLAQGIKDLWVREDIRTPMDLAGCYTSEDDLNEELAKANVPKTDWPLAITFWKSAPRDMRQMASAQPVAAQPKESPRQVVDDEPMAKRRRGPPKQLHEPGLFHTQWMERDLMKQQRSAQSQGLQPAHPEHLDEVWSIYLRAGKTSTLHRTGSDENALKTLLLRPIARYADSLPARLAAWRRWERWASAQQPGSVQTPFKPTDILMGKFLMEVDKGGATAASQAWAGLKWWSDRLGLELALQSPLVADFRLKVPGHTTEQAKVLPLDAIPPLRELARGGGTRGTFASILLLIAGGCVRFVHVQRSAIVNITDELIVFRCAKGKKRRQGVREAYRWATPRCWSPGSDTVAKAICLIQDVAAKAEGYGNAPFLIPDISTAQGHSIEPGDVWLPRPMRYKRFVTLMRTLLVDMGSPGPASGWTFNALRRLMPTGADTLQFSDSVATAIGNWQDTPRGGPDVKRGKMRDQMSKLYAGDKVTTAGHYKIKVVVAIWHAGNTGDPSGGSEWSRVRHLCPDKETLNHLTKQFAVQGGVIRDPSDPGCLPNLPRGPLRHRHEEPLREVPALDSLAWSVQFLATNLQRPWVHFAPTPGERPYCRSAKFRRDPIRTGRGLAEAASTGERPCPKCIARLGDKAPTVMAEFCVTEGEPMQRAVNA